MKTIHSLLTFSIISFVFLTNCALFTYIPYNAGLLMDRSAPDVPLEFRVYASDGIATLTWVDPPNSDLRYIFVEYYPEYNESMIKTIKVNKGIQALIVKNLINGTTYNFKIYTVDYADNKSGAQYSSVIPAGKNTAMFFIMPPSFSNDTTPEFKVFGNDVREYYWRMSDETDDYWHGPVAVSEAPVIDMSSRSDGSYTISARGVDNEGNVQSDETPSDYRWVYDITPPAVSNLSIIPASFSRYGGGAITAVPESISDNYSNVEKIVYKLQCSFNDGLSWTYQQDIWSSINNKLNINQIDDLYEAYKFRAAFKDEAGNISYTEDIQIKDQFFIDFYKAVTYSGGNSLVFNAVTSDSKGFFYAAGYIYGGPFILGSKLAIQSEFKTGVIVKFDAESGAPVGSVMVSRDGNGGECEFRDIVFKNNKLYVAGKVSSDSSQSVNFYLDGDTTNNNSLVALTELIGDRALLGVYNTGLECLFGSSSQTNGSCFNGVDADANGYIYTVGCISGKDDFKFPHNSTNVTVSTENTVLYHPLIINYNSSYMPVNGFTWVQNGEIVSELTDVSVSEDRLFVGGYAASNTTSAQFTLWNGQSPIKIAGAHCKGYYIWAKDLSTNANYCYTGTFAFGDEGDIHDLLSYTGGVYVAGYQGGKSVLVKLNDNLTGGTPVEVSGGYIRSLTNYNNNIIAIGSMKSGITIGSFSLSMTQDATQSTMILEFDDDFEPLRGWTQIQYGSVSGLVSDYNAGYSNGDSIFAVGTINQKSVNLGLTGDLDQAVIEPVNNSLLLVRYK